MGWFVLWATTLTMTVALGGVAPLFGQSYLVRVYTEADGLPSSSVYDVAKGPDGRLWFATRSGVCVYDGVVWQQFSLEDGIASTAFLRIEVEADGTVWALNNTHIQVYYRRDGAWHGLPAFDDHEWNWYTASDFALLHSRGVTVPAVSSRLGLFVWDGEQWHHFAVGPVLALAEFDGRLVFGTRQGLFELRDPSAEPVPLGLPGLAVSGLSVEHDPVSGPVLWAHAGRQLLRFVDGDFEVVRDALPLLAEEPGELRLAPDGLGGFYAADREKLVHLEADGGHTFFDHRQGFAAGGASALLPGDDGILWTTSERGVSKLVSRRFASYRKADGLFASEVSAILEISPGLVLFGHDGGMTLVREGRAVATVALPRTSEEPSDGRRIMDLVLRGRDVWAIAAAGVWRLPEGDFSRLTPVPADPTDLLPLPLAAAAVTRSGRLWVAGRGLAVFEDGAYKTVELPAGGVAIRRLHLVGGDLYAATVGRGLWRLSEGQWSMAAQADGSAPSLYTAMDWRSEIWAGASEGLFREVDGRLQKSTDPAIDRPVFALVEGDDGALWVGTDFGVVRFDGQSTRRFGLRDGLVGLETNRDGMAVDHRGDLWIGTALGASRYDATYDVVPKPPTPTLDGVEVGGEWETFDGPMTLAWHRNQLSFRFRAVSFLDEEHLEFSGRLSGFDDDFQPPSRALGRRMHYTNLPPGEYRFQVRARHGPENDWGPVVSSPTLHIGRPFWSEPAFFVVALLGLILTAAAVVSHLVTRRHGRQLEQLVGERTRELVASNERLVEEVNEHRRTEERLRAAKTDAEAASLAKSRFLAVMSHEIRTPMAGVLGTAELLERQTLGERQLTQVQTLRRSGEALLVLLDDILDYSRIEADRLELLRRPFSLPPLLDGVVALFSPMAAEKGVDLRLQVDPETPSGFSGDVSRVRQVLVNLTGNALKFTDSGAVEIRARWREQRLALAVRDTGIGIAEAEHRRLFEPFQQVDSSVVRRYGGTGLGLAICRRLVDAMGGEIELESRVGAGSTFTVWLPLEPCAQPRDQPPRSATAAAAGAETLAAKVLVAEDNPMVQILTLEMLDVLGCAADVVANGQEVLEALERTSYDIILMDVQMPVLDGLETARRINERWPDAHPPIIALTAHALHGDREICLDAGMDDYLTKPMTLGGLEATIKAWVPCRRREQGRR